MEEEKNIGLCIWKNFYKTIKMLPKKEQQGLALAILDYAFSGETSDLTLIQKLALEPMKPSLKIRSFGGAPKGNSNAKKTTVNTTVDLKEDNSYSTVDTTDKTTVDLKEKKKDQKENKINIYNTPVLNKFNTPPKKEEVLKKRYGEFGKVKLSDEEYFKLGQVYHDKREEAIQILDDYLSAHGDKYKSHYAVLKSNNWVYNKIFKETANNENTKTFAKGCGNDPKDCYL